MKECRVCGGKDVFELCRTSYGSIIFCKSCHIGRTAYNEDSSPSQSVYDTENWVEKRDSLAPYIKYRARQRYELLKRRFPGKRLLEIGCGTGEFSAEAHANGHEVTAVELSAQACEYAREALPGVDVRNCYLQDAGIPDGSFDVVAGHHVLEHIGDLDVFIRDLRRILKPGGLAFFIVPNVGCWYRKVLGTKWWGFLNEHIWQFTPKGLDKVFKKNGWEVVSVGTIEDYRYSLWPALPLLLNTRALNRVFDKLSSFRKKRAGGGAGVSESPSGRGQVRAGVTKVLARAFMLFRRVGSIPFYPLVYLQKRMDGGGEAYIMARAPEKL